jgi:outer membrane lipoprotein-sorting protein
MTVFDRRPLLRWLVPVLAALVLAVGGGAVGVISATARGGLPDRTASRLLVDVQRSRLDGLSGTIVQNADLGLPSLPGVAGSGSSDLSSMVSGSHTLRLWYAGPDHVRLALLGSLGESDVVRKGSDLWTWSSQQKKASHRTLSGSADATPQSLAGASPLTPQQAADAALKAITPSTKVSTDGTAVVAGRSAYELLLQPKDSSSLVSSVRVAIDGKTHIPLRVQVYGANTGKPALEVGFTSFDASRPDASVFRFNPPPGTRVTDGSSPSTQGNARDLVKPSDSQPRVVGSGWTSVVVAKAPAMTGSATGPATGPGGAGSLSTLTKALPAVSGSWGSGHLLSGTLFSAVLTDDGRVAVGAVAPDRLYQALGSR